MEQKRMGKNYIYRYKPYNECKRIKHYKYINLSPEQLTTNLYYIKNIKKQNKDLPVKSNQISLWKDFKNFIKEFFLFWINIK